MFDFSLQLLCTGKSGTLSRLVREIGQTRTVHVHKFVCSGTLEERIDECIAALPRLVPSRSARDVIKKHAENGKLFVVGGPLSSFTRVMRWQDDENIQQQLLARDEKAAAKALRDVEVRAVVVFRDLDGAVDRDSRVLARLVNHDHLEWFELKVAARDYFVYSVRASRATIGLATGQQLLAGLRDRLEDLPVEQPLVEAVQAGLLLRSRLRHDEEQRHEQRHDQQDPAQPAWLLRVAGVGIFGLLGVGVGHSESRPAAAEREAAGRAPLSSSSKVRLKGKRDLARQVRRSLCDCAALILADRGPEFTDVGDATLP